MERAHSRGPTYDVEVASVLLFKNNISTMQVFRKNGFYSKVMVIKWYLFKDMFKAMDLHYDNGFSLLTEPSWEWIFFVFYCFRGTLFLGDNKHSVYKQTNSNSNSNSNNNNNNNII